MQIFGEIRFIKPQNDTLTTDKRSKMTKNDNKTYLVLVEFLQLVQCLEDHAKNLPSTKQAVKTQPK